MMIAKTKGWTSLMYAAYFGHEKVASILLRYGADTSLEIQGWKAIDLARSRGFRQIVSLISSQTSDQTVNRSVNHRSATHRSLSPPKSSSMPSP